jgi:hypothetical protein
LFSDPGVRPFGLVFVRAIFLALKWFGLPSIYFRPRRLKTR